jgi:hypothetical protein
MQDEECDSIAGMGNDLFFGILFLIASLSFFVGAFMAKRKGNERTFTVRLIGGIAMLLLAAHNLIRLG